MLVLARSSALLFTMPMFSGRQIPTQVRVGVTFLLAFVITPTVAPLSVPLGFAPLAVALVSQVFIGMLMGYLANLIFAGIQFAGELIDTQVGFAITNIINPLNGNQVSVLGQFETIIASLIFFALDAHLSLIASLAGSFDLVPLPYVTLRPELMSNIMLLFSMAMMIIFHIAIPVLAALFITNIALGLLARVAPQINVFIVGLPGQLGLGVLMFGLSLPLLGYVLPHVFGELPHQLDATLRTMQPVH